MGHLPSASRGPREWVGRWTKGIYGSSEGAGVDGGFVRAAARAEKRFVC